MEKYYLIGFLLSFVLSFGFTFVVRGLATRYSIVDKPDTERKKHEKAIPLMGGTAIFLSFFVCLYFFRDFLVAGDLDYRHWVGFFVASLFLIFGGFLDDKYNLKAKYQIIFPVLAILVIVIAGVNIEKISNPFAEAYIYLDFFKINLFQISGIVYSLSLLSSFIIFLWLIGMMYTTKLLDGVDGLVTGVTFIGALIIFLFTITEKYYQADIALASIILAGASLAFLIFNFNPASIFLGEGASLFLGFALGVLAIISGGKIAIALLVMGIPIMDAALTIYRRIRQGKNPFKFSGRDHLHFRILDSGIGAKKTVFIYYVLALSFGLSALFLQSSGKLMALGLLILVMFIIVLIFNKENKNKCT